MHTDSIFGKVPFLYEAEFDNPVGLYYKETVFSKD